MFKMSKSAALIDIRAEWVVANENIQRYSLIKEQYIKTVSKYPHQINADLVMNILCDQHDMKRIDFDFIYTIEKQHFTDMVDQFKKPPGKLK